MRALSLVVRATLLWCLALGLPGCIDPYMPDAISSTNKYLVVDGFINSRGITTINLSRTYDIAAPGAAPVESGATVAIEEEGGVRYPLRESTVKGTYTSAALTLNPAKSYRLYVRTSASKTYTSDYVPVKTTPPIDRVSWQAATTGLNIYVNSHDDTNLTQYYKWDYEETWEITPPYFPDLEYKNGAIRDLSVPFPNMCWVNGRSTDIKISNTVRLSQDVISNYLICSFPTTANRFSSRYSILVKQYAQTAEEYMYWELLKKNTENIGTLFDPLPAQLTGNIRCIEDEAELALGYIGAHSVTEKRIFIRRSELPRTWFVQTGYESCLPPDTVFLFPRGVNPPPDPVEIIRAAFSGPNYLPISSYFDPMSGRLVGYTAKSRDCIDCRTRGTAVKPSFWP